MSNETDGRQRRRDLLETVEEQKQTILKYETRLKDVVRAYKGLVKEKEALEASLKAITETNPEGASQDDKDDAKSPRDVDSLSSISQRSNEEYLEAKVRTLTASIGTLTTEKSRVEAMFQEDRKKLVAEKKERDRALAKLQKEFEEFKAKAKLEIEEAKSKVIVERHAREKEMSDHGVMIKELQKLLADERRSKEKLETALDASNSSKAQETEAKAKAAESMAAKSDAKKIRDLEMKLRLSTEEAHKTKQELQKVIPELENTRRELEHAKIVHQRDLDRHESRTEMAEARVVSVRMEQEQRVNSLEARLQELSETIGTYDRLRQHDQEEIAKLTEKLDKLSRDYRRQSSGSRHDSVSMGDSSRLSESNVNEGDEDEITMMIEKFFKLKKFLKEKAKENPMDLKGSTLIAESTVVPWKKIDFAFAGVLEDDDLEAMKWKKHYEDLRREFDDFKAKANQAPTSSPSSRYLLPEVDQEVILSLKTQISDLQDKISALRVQLVSVEKERDEGFEREKNLNDQMVQLKEEWRSKLHSAESEHRTKLSQMETELQKQRERCLTLIEEKEDEVNMLKSNMELAFESAFTSPDKESKYRMAAASLVSNASSSSGRKRSTSSKDGSFEAQSGADDLTAGLKSNSEGMVLHYVQELSHKDVEISTLRQKVFQVESTLREVQMNSVAKEEKYLEQIENLNETVARLRRMSSNGSGKDGANLEYLKNVVLSYMLSSDAKSREHMLKAIGAVLIFSNGEMKRVRDHNASWFWTHSSGTAKKT